MATLVDAGIGTGQTSTGITGRKDRFDFGEKIYAQINYKDVEKNTVSLIQLERVENGDFNVLAEHEFIASKDFFTMYHWVWYNNYPAGNYNVRFRRNGQTISTNTFKIISVEPEPKPEPTPIYPKSISRGEISFDALNEEQEIQLKDFLGIFPKGMALDDYLRTFDLEAINRWELSWRNIWGDRGRTDLMTFTANKAEKFRLLLVEILKPEKTWWEKLRDLIITPAEIALVVNETAFGKGYELLTGTIIPTIPTQRQLTEMADWILPINLLTILSTGKNLSGEVVEFGDDELSWELAGAALIFTPFRFVGKIGKLISGKISGKGLFEVAGKMSAKKATPRQIEALLRTDNFGAVLEAMRKDPRSYAKMASKWSPQTQALVSKSLEKQHPRTAYRLMEKALEENAQKITGISGVALKLPGSKTILFGLTGIAGLLGMAYGIPFGTSWFAKEGLKEMLEIPLSDRMRDYRRNPTPELLAIIRSDIEKVRKVIPLARGLIESVSWLWPFTKEGWDFYVENMSFGIDQIEEELRLIELPEPTELVTIKTTPSDADITISGVDFVGNPFERALPLRTYDVVVSRFGYIPDSFSFTLREGIPENIVITLNPEIDELSPVEEIPPEDIELLKGILSIQALPEGVTILIPGQPEITTSGQFKLNAGSYDVTASMDGFVSQTKKAFIKERKATTLTFSLEEIERPGEIPIKPTLRITSNPDNADVYIDGQFQFTTTPYTKVVEPGTYIIRVQKDGFYPVESAVVLAEGDNIEFPFILDLIPVEVIPEVPYTPYQPYIPDYFPPTPYFPPASPFSYEQTPQINFVNLSARPRGISSTPFIALPVEKEMMINIETTGLKPWESRLFSIAWLDLTTPGAETQVIVDDDEEGIIKTWLEIFEAGNYVKIVGFNTQFDYRFIMSRLWYYRLQSKALFDAEMRDVKQLVDQVKEKFVYGSGRKGKLEDWGKYLLGKGKLVTQETLLRGYLEGNFNLVSAFQIRQIEMTKEIYDLVRFSSFEAVETSNLSPIDTGSHLETQETPTLPTILAEKKCKECLQLNPLDATECLVCGNQI